MLTVAFLIFSCDKVRAITVRADASRSVFALKQSTEPPGLYLIKSKLPEIFWYDDSEWHNLNIQPG